ncbi:AraC family transcriptional regulator [Mycolicibacterium sp. Dal123E01]|uniref:AraC family transcriptional regulator n=1 Tax=Mycolicibacterium sp. Dal123E01 TaxID=3457578 RepID=UPI00403E6461
MGYREVAPSRPLQPLVECIWRSDGHRSTRVLPDGCMDLIELNGSIVVAGPDTAAFVSDHDSIEVTGLRFHPGVLPRLLGVPAAELLNARVPLAELRPDVRGSLTDVTGQLLSGETTNETAPWTLRQLAAVTKALGRGAVVSDVAREIGWSTRHLQRQCVNVYGYGPATLRRVLRFRRAVTMLRAELSVAETTARAGYADQSHLHREVRAFSGLSVAAVVIPAPQTDRPSCRPGR